MNANISLGERVFRVISGVLFMVLGAKQVFSSDVVSYLLIAVGVIITCTGVFGFCGIYAYNCGSSCAKTPRREVSHISSADVERAIEMTASRPRPSRPIQKVEERRSYPAAKAPAKDEMTPAMKRIVERYGGKVPAKVELRKSTMGAMTGKASSEFGTKQKMSHLIENIKKEVPRSLASKKSK